MMLRERGNGPLSRWKAGETAFINETLARQLAAREGDEIILRVRKPSALGLDAAISPRNEGHRCPPAQGRRDPDPRPARRLRPYRAARPAGKPVSAPGIPGRRTSASPTSANLLVAGPILAERKPSRWDGLRDEVARWLWMHAPHSV